MDPDSSQQAEQSQSHNSNDQRFIKDHLQKEPVCGVQNGLGHTPESESEDYGKSGQFAQSGNDCLTKENDYDSADTGDDVTDADGAQANGDIFSPDSADMVTVICSADSKRREEQDKVGWDGSDTHSDSIETLEEESPHDDSQDQLSDSVLKQICLANQMVKGEDVFSTDSESKQTAVCKSKQGKETAEDSRSTDSHEVIPDTSTGAGVSACRPESLSLPRPLQYYERNRSSSEPHRENRCVENVRAEASVRHQRTRSEALEINGVRVRGDLGHGDDIMTRSLPQGTITRKGTMVEFVADDLTEKIRRSSPMSAADSGSMGSRRSSQRSLASSSSATSAATSSGVSRSPSSLLTQSPDAAPPIDPSAIMELEMAARRVADSVDHMMGNLKNNLHKMSAITVGCSEAYKTSVDITCDSVDSSIKAMYALMAKCEELSTTMAPIYQIGTQIKEIKRLLDRFEAQLSEKP